MQTFIKFFFITLWISFTGMSLAAQFTATIDRNTISINETLNLNLIYNADSGGAPLDSSGLQRDFNVLSTSPSRQSSIQIVNGQTRQSTMLSWRIVLAPKRIGQLLIPQMVLNGSPSQPITINVTAANTGVSGTPERVKAKALFDNKTAYLNQQLILTFRFSFAAGVSPGGFSFKQDGINVAPTMLGQNKYQIIEQGIQYWIVEVVYALFPNKVSTLTVPAQLITATYQGRQISARTEPISIVVNAPPTHQQYTNAEWLPAKNVNLRAEWSDKNKNFRIGEPITRTLILEVDGQQKVLLPSIKLPDIEGIKYYADQPQLDQTQSTTGIKSTRIQGTALIAEKLGKFTLPAIELPWWNTKNQQWQIASIPAEEINVTPSTRLIELPPQEFVAEQVTSPVHPVSITQLKWSQSSLWFYLSLFLLIVCIYLAYLLHRHNKLTLVEATNITHIEDEKQLWKQLINSIEQKNFNVFRIHLLKWARCYWYPETINSLEDVSQKINSPTFTEEINNLYNHKYSNVSSQYSYNVLLLKTALENARRNAIKNKDKTSTLPKLYA